MIRRCALLLLFACVAPAQAAPPRHVVLRMAAIAPEGTAWAREVHAFSADVATATQGRLQVKWYLGAIAGNEIEVADRIRRGQLDGTAAAMLCTRLSPALRVMRVAGLFQSRDEQAYASGRILPRIDEELRHAGFINMGTTVLGPEVIFSRQPVRTLDDLRHMKLWRWDLDDVALDIARRLGMKIVALPPDQAARAYDEGRIDGFIGVPDAALAFQWYARARYFTPLALDYLPACMVFSERSFDRLPTDMQDAVRTASAHLDARIEMVGKRDDDMLLGGLFARQGLKPVPVSAQFRARFLAAARAARETLPPALVPRDVLQQVLGLLADYREEHRQGASR